MMENLAALEEMNKNNSELEVVCMEDVEMKRVEWLWLGNIARGKLTVMAGNPGLGKSQITAFFAATVSRAGLWPDEKILAEAGSVIILSAEDDAADTIKPRLLAADADVKCCHVLQAVKTFKDGIEGSRTFDLTRDITKLGEAIQRIGNVRLVIIDPISAYMGKTDSNNNADMRGLLAPLAVMAAQYNVAVILVTHFNKSRDQEALARVIGSIGLIAAARAGYAVVKDAVNPDIRHFVPLKNNIGNDKDGFSFRIESVTLEGNFETSRVRWLPGTVDAHKILNPVKPASGGGAQEFLKELLSSGAMPVRDIYPQGDATGYSEAVLRRAAGRIGVVKKKLGMKDGWIWSLPEDTEHDEDNTPPGAESSLATDKSLPEEEATPVIAPPSSSS